MSNKQTPDTMDLKKTALGHAVTVEGELNSTKVLGTAKEYFEFLSADPEEPKLVPLEALKDTWKDSIKSGDIVKFTG